MERPHARPSFLKMGAGSQLVPPFVPLPDIPLRRCSSRKTTHYGQGWLMLMAFEVRSPVGQHVSPIPILLNDTFGAILIGTMIGLLMYGVNLHQVYQYFRAFPSDGLYMKTTVVTILLAETLYASLGIHICYYYLVASERSADALETAIWRVR
ncbi:hypothetical protein C8Q76DRAFT_156945 [Earliella scabrosa]|nr:hypothetical protein C8Q76DRAFT_156945 [Earliella scabrosa]